MVMLDVIKKIVYGKGFSIMSCFIFDSTI